MRTSWMIGLSGDVNFTSKYFTQNNNDPLAVQPGFAHINVGTRLYSSDDSMEIALIGSNITSKYYVEASHDRLFSGECCSEGYSSAKKTRKSGPVIRRMGFIRLRKNDLLERLSEFLAGSAMGERLELPRLIAPLRRQAAASRLHMETIYATNDFCSICNVFGRCVAFAIRANERSA